MIENLDSATSDPTSYPNELIYHTLYRRLGTNIMFARYRHGMSQEVFADFCGLTRAQIRSFEKGLGEFRFNNFLKICSALNCEPEFLMKQHEEIRTFVRSEIEAIEDANSTITYPAFRTGQSQVKKISLRRHEKIDLICQDEQIDLYVLSGNISVRSESSTSEGSRHSCLSVGGTGNFNIINFFTDISEILMMKR
jgi:transcriptional regulator with XRE-family HTH domain